MGVTYMGTCNDAFNNNRIYKTLDNGNTWVLLMVVLLLSVYASAVVIQHFRYNEDGFNCKDMSYELGNVLKTIGFKPQVVYAHRVDGNGCIVSAHCWVRLYGLDIESTMLMPKVDVNGWIIDDIREIP